MSYTICSRFKGEHIVYAGYTICTSREHIVYGAFCGSTDVRAAFGNIECIEIVFIFCSFQQLYRRNQLYENNIIIIGPRREKTSLRGFHQSEFQTSLLSYRD